MPQRDKRRIFRAPGRVNLIGEHIDYNQGLVMPIAIEQEIRVSALSRTDRVVIMRSKNFLGECSFSLDNIEPSEKERWGNYPKGVMKALQEAGYRLGGAELEFDGNIPAGGGMSSSAAIEVVTAVAMLTLSGIVADSVEISLLCQRAENEFVGVNCGIMDQFISAMGKKDHALLIDCRDLSHRQVPLPFSGYKIIACNSRVKHSLISSEYNKRREECTAGVKKIAEKVPTVSSLRDVDEKILEQYKDMLEKVIFKRCRHVITEIDRVCQTVIALDDGDLIRFGKLMNESHTSLKNDYEVSCPELDILVERALEIEGVLGSRMTGGGFGGCTISLVQEDCVDNFCRMMAEKYMTETGITPEFYPCRPMDGAGELMGTD